MRLVLIKVIAILFIIAAVITIIAGVPYKNNYIGIASVLGTLAGAILVFSTLEMQIKTLNEQKYRNEIERFDSRFYPILSSLRTDASNMEITGNYLSSRGIGTTSSYKGERAFAAAKSMINGLNRCLGDKSFREFDMNEFEDVLHNYSEIFDALDEDFTCPDDIDKIEKERREYITSNQVLYLIYKWGITKDDIIKFKHMDSKGKESFLLDTLIKHQTANFSKYIQSLRFILQIIRATEFQTERKDYYQHVSCRIGKEELEFLKFFSEFNIITEIYYGQK